MINMFTVQVKINAMTPLKSYINTAFIYDKREQLRHFSGRYMGAAKKRYGAPTLCESIAGWILYGCRLPTPLQLQILWTLSSLFENTLDKIYYLVPTIPHSQCTSLLQHIAKRRSNRRFLIIFLCKKINWGFYCLSNMMIVKQFLIIV